jgi:hypothetical protein
MASQLARVFRVVTASNREQTECDGKPIRAQALCLGSPPNDKLSRLWDAPQNTAIAGSCHFSATRQMCVLMKSRIALAIALSIFASPVRAEKIALVNGTLINPATSQIVGGEAGAHIGKIENGNFADLVILKSNPVDDIANASDIDSVMKNGTHYQAAELVRSLP